jgi:hypothetical protein
MPRLYRQRKREGDDERARLVSTLRRRLRESEEEARSGKNEWLRPTLLGAVFDAGNPDKAEGLAAEVGVEGAARWKLQTTMPDLESSVILVADSDLRARLEAVLQTLKASAAYSSLRAQRSGECF